MDCQQQQHNKKNGHQSQEIPLLWGRYLFVVLILIQISNNPTRGYTCSLSATSRGRLLCQHGTKSASGVFDTQRVTILFLQQAKEQKGGRGGGKPLQEINNYVDSRETLNDASSVATGKLSKRQKLKRLLQRMGNLAPTLKVCFPSFRARMKCIAKQLQEMEETKVISGGSEVHVDSLDMTDGDMNMDYRDDDSILEEDVDNEDGRHGVDEGVKLEGFPAMFMESDGSDDENAGSQAGSVAMDIDDEEDVNVEARPTQEYQKVNEVMDNKSADDLASKSPEGADSQHDRSATEASNQVTQEIDGAIDKRSMDDHLASETPEEADAQEDRSATAASHVDLSGTWRPIVTSEFKAQYDEYLQNCGQSYLFRKVVVNGISLQKEIIRHLDNGANLQIVATNPAGNWNRTLVASASKDPIFVTMQDPDGDTVQVEAWWENNGKVHKSWLRNKPRLLGGAFETSRYLSDDDPNILFCDSVFHPSQGDDAPKNNKGFKYGRVLWKFQREGA